MGKNKGKHTRYIAYAVFAVVLIAGALAAADVFPGSLNDSIDDSLSKGLDQREVSTSDMPPVTVHFIDVGQADCIFIDAGDTDILIDGGNSSDGELVRDYLYDLGTDDIELMIATHPHEDHIGGLDEIIYAFDVDLLLRPFFSMSSKTNKDFEDAIYAQSVPEAWPEQGDVYAFGDLVFTVISDKTRNYEDANNNSIVVRMDYGDTSFLFTGDAEAAAEHDILESGIDIKADVYKVAHHGSSTSNTAMYLNTVDPQYAVISVGDDNQYGLPDETIINRLELMDVVTLRTDRMGTIIFSTDGTNLDYAISGQMPEGIPVGAPDDQS